MQAVSLIYTGFKKYLNNTGMCQECMPHQLPPTTLCSLGQSVHGEAMVVAELLIYLLLSSGVVNDFFYHSFERSCNDYFSSLVLKYNILAFLILFKFLRSNLRVPQSLNEH